MSNVFAFGTAEPRRITKPGCTGMSAVRIHSDPDEGLVVVELRFEPGGEMDEHRVDHPILFIVTSGSGQAWVNGEPTEIGAGESVYWPQDTLHKVSAGESGMVAIAVEYAIKDVE